MKAEHPETNTKLIPLLLLGASMVFGTLIYAKTTRFLAEPAWAEGLVRRMGEQDRPNDDQANEAMEKSRETAAALKKENFFSPLGPKQHPVTSVLGILGNEALIGNKWYKAGSRVQDARIVAVEATQVRIEWDGKEKTFAPLRSANQLASGGTRQFSRSAKSVPSSQGPTRKTPQRITTARTRPTVRRSPEDRKKSQSKAEKQRLATEKKERQRASREEATKSKRERKKKTPEEIREAKEKAAEKRAQRPAKNKK
jgi:hypothetical protein